MYSIHITQVKNCARLKHRFKPFRVLIVIINSSVSFFTGKEGASAGAVDEEDFIKAFEDVPNVQVSLTHITGTRLKCVRVLQQKSVCPGDLFAATVLCSQLVRHTFSPL